MNLRLWLETERSTLAVRQVSTLVHGAFASVLQPGCLGAIEIAVTELFTNAVVHGSPRSESLPLRLELALEDESFMVRLEDEGSTFDPRQFRRREHDTDDRRSLPTSGMGLALIHDSMDEVRWEQSPTAGVTTLLRRVARRDLQHLAAVGVTTVGVTTVGVAADRDALAPGAETAPARDSASSQT